MEVTSSLLSQTPSVLRTVLMVGRGGAAAAAVSALSEGIVTPDAGLSSTLITPGGGQPVPQESLLGIAMSPEAKAVFFMSLAMACHYLGYSFARPITISLFTSASTGYKSAGAFPFAMAFVSPMSVLLLMGYNWLLNQYGPKGTLQRSTLFSGVVINLAAMAITVVQKSGLEFQGVPVAKFITGPLFVFREAYVQLLTSQFWSFMASVLTPNQSAKWFAPIAGMTSMASAMGGFAVAPLTARVGIIGALFGTGIMLFLSMLGSRMAYKIADQYGFTPTDVKKKQTGKISAETHSQNLFQKASRLFQRVPVLRALFVEILASQGLATVLNVCFVERLSSAITDDNQRASWVGSFYAITNVVTMLLQFGVLPPLMTVIEPRDLWRAIPVISLIFTAFQFFQENPSLYVVSATLLVMKVSEYSARRMLDEMVFVPLDFESRFVGKEVIGVFGHRFAKSLMSLGLSGLTQLLPSFGIRELSLTSNLVAFGWLKAAWTLSNLVPTRAEAEESFQNTKNPKGKNKRG